MHARTTAERTGREHHYAWVPVEDLTLLSLIDGENRLVVTARRHSVPGQAERWFDLRFDAAASPFVGVVTDTVTETDLTFFKSLLEGMTVPGEVVFGDERAAELILALEPQVGGPAGAFVVEVRLTPSAADPWPSLRWLLSNQRPFWDDAASAIQSLLEDSD